MSEKKIDFVWWSDWTALYIDGKSVYQGHTLDETHLLDLLGIPYSTMSVPDDDMSWALCHIENLDDLKQQIADGSYKELPDDE